MSVKILGGLARGFSLATPKSGATRPTSVMVRRRLFDWRQSLSGQTFIDLFAGSGAMGLEALSRGAERTFLIDSHRLAFQILKQNSEKFLQSFKLDSSKVVLSSADSLKWLQREFNLHSINHEDTVLYLDPPYEQHELYQKVLKALLEMKFEGEVWIEGDRLKGPSFELLNQAMKSVIKSFDQGDHFVLVGKVI